MKSPPSSWPFYLLRDLLTEQMGQIPANFLHSDDIEIDWFPCCPIADKAPDQQHEQPKQGSYCTAYCKILNNKIRHFCILARVHFMRPLIFSIEHLRVQLIFTRQLLCVQTELFRNFFPIKKIINLIDQSSQIYFLRDLIFKT